ncbi:MAG TPA: nuclear transport factor 2 family protein [Chloroflexota bacterium]|jgi:ketosteroid isomerase-like protein|nr:nuclear transport factor 2 family protein [Chloroflexota bacterium]
MDPLDRLTQALNNHDLDALVDCFTVDYISETPVHPARNFVGRDQVRRNWSQILASVADLSAELIRSTVDPTQVWAEWDWHGSGPGGQPFSMRGVTILEPDASGERFRLARFYMEPLQRDEVGPDAAVRHAVAQPRGA